MNLLMNQLPTLLTFSPLLGVVVLLAVPGKQLRWVRAAGMLATLPPLLLALLMYARFDPGAKGVQFAQSVPWFSIPAGMESLEFFYSMGADGLSMPLAVMTAVIAALAAVASMYIRKRVKMYFILFLLLEMGMLGVFLAQNLLLFFLFFEITLVTTFILVGFWGYVHRERAANWFLLYNGLGSAVMLLAFIGLLILFRTPEFSKMQELSAMLPVQDGAVGRIQWMIFAGIVIAFGIKLPLFPFHSWMVRVHTEAAPSVVMIHAGVLLKMGAYGLIRFGAGLFPAQVREAAVLLAVLGLVNILYGAVLAFVQRDLKRVLAYSSISHMGIVLLGIASLNIAGLTGALFQTVSHGFIAALLFFLIFSLTERTGTTRIDELGGMAKAMPVLSGLLLAAGLALLGLPGMSGFISEFLAFLGLFKSEPALAAVGALGLILAAAYTLRAVLRTTFGPLSGHWEKLTDVRPAESAPMLVLLGLIILIGVYPAVLGEPMQTTLHAIVARMGG